MKKILTANETERIAALKSYHLLDTIAEEEYDRITRLASIICDVPISTISLIDEERQWFKSRVGLDVSETAREISFCQHAILDTNLFTVEDAKKDDRFKDNPLVTADPHIRFYAGYPLIDPNGNALGTICVIDQIPRELSARQKEAMQILSEEIMSLILNRRRNYELKNFEKLFNFSSDLVCIAGTDGYFKKINPAFANKLGFDEKYLISTPFLEMVHVDDIETTKQELKNLSNGYATINFKNRFRTSKGNYIYLEWVASPEKETGLLFAIARDITSEKLKEDKIAQSESKFRAFFESSQGLMCTHDVEGNFLTVNTSGASLIGYTVDELLTKNLKDIIPQHLHTELSYYLNEITTTGKSAGKMVTLHKNGTARIWMYSNILEENEDGQKYVIGNSIDITDLHYLELDLAKSRKLLNDVLKSAVEVSIIATDINGTITLFNAGAEEMLGYEASEIVSKTSPIFIHDELEIIAHASELSKKYNINISGFDVFTYEAVLNGASQKEWTYIRKDGSKILVSLVVSPIYDVNDIIIGYLGIANDITEKRKQFDELEKAKILAEQANVAKSEFLANMSHEIRTPLNGVIGFTDLVLKTNLNETQEQYISIVNQSANSLLGIINDILDFSKIEAGKLELDLERTDLFEIASQATDIITYQAHSKGLEVLLNVSTSLPRFVYTDNIRLKQIIVNLLGNAVKFTEKGEIELKINALEKIDEENIVFRIQVKDTGIGIHPDKLDKIFEAFAQEDSSTTKKYGGTGLGLTISNQLLKLMNSTLQLQSVLGEGSTFYFDVLLKVEYADAEVWDTVSDIKNVLIVDDNVNNRMILRQMLSLNKINSTEAANGIEAIKVLSEKNNFDVIIMDYHMPYMDGLETIKKIRENFQTTEHLQPIILLYSSNDDEKIIKACEEYKVNYKLVKPIKMNDLYQAFNNLNAKNGKKKNEDQTEKLLIVKNPKILIAEDNSVNMLLSKTIVKKAVPNAEILEAVSGKEAIEIFESVELDLIFMDIQMPIMNGYEATGIIRKLENKNYVPIIALTAGNVKGEKEKCLELGMDDFVVKPINQSAIYDVLKKWLIIKENKKDFIGLNDDERVHFNKNTIRNLVDHNEEMLEELLTQLNIELNNYKLEIKHQLKDTQLQTCKSIGHKVYGMASSIGMEVLADLAKEIEIEEYNEAQMKAKLVELNTEFELLLNLI